MQWYEQLCVAGSVASLVGAFFSWLAAFRAQKAVAAAEEARDVYQRQTIVESCNLAFQKATVVREFGRAKNWTVLRVKMEDLHDWCTMTQHQYAGTVPDIDRGLQNTLLLLKLTFGNIDDVIGGRGIERDAEDILRQTDKICAQLSELTGIAQKMITELRPRGR